MKWGVRRYQNKDGTHTPLGRQRDRLRNVKRHKYDTYDSKDQVFISGKVKYDKPLDTELKREIDAIMKSNAHVLIGDAPGADTRVQDYLASKHYLNVTVYTTDKTARNNVGGWTVKKIARNGAKDEREWRAQKDIAMTKKANRGLAISSEDDRPDSATSKNVQRLRDDGSNVNFYDYKTGKWSLK